MEIMQMKIRILIIQNKTETGLQVLHQTHTKRLFAIYMKFRFNWMPCVFFFNLLNLATLSCKPESQQLFQRGAGLWVPLRERVVPGMQEGACNCCWLMTCSLEIETRETQCHCSFLRG